LLPSVTPVLFISSINPFLPHETGT
jgi:hypothetical protein